MRLSYLLIGIILITSCTQEVKQTVENENESYIELKNDSVYFVFEDELVSQLPIDKNIHRSNIAQNKRNIVIAENINPDQEPKAQLWVLNLYNIKGELVSKSNPVELYDSYFISVGNDTTILLYNVMGGSFTTKLYNTNNSELTVSKTLEYKTHAGIIKCNVDGNVFGIIVNDREANTSTIEMFDCYGSLLLSKSFSHTIHGGLFISSNAEYFVTIAFIDDENQVSILSKTGKPLFRQTIEHVGNYTAELSDKFVVVYSRKNLYFIDKLNSELLADYALTYDTIRIDEVKINEANYIIVKENHLDIVNKRELPTVNYSLIYQMDTLGRKELIDRINNL